MAFRRTLCQSRMVEGALRAPETTFKHARALRKTMTLPEVLLWQALRRTQLDGLRFRRQHPIGPCILDFYCPALRLAVEIDSAAHDNADRMSRDDSRTAWLARSGIEVLRFMAMDIVKEASRRDVQATILAHAQTRSVLLPSSAALRALPHDAEEPAPSPSTALRAVPLPRYAGEDMLRP